MGRFRTVGLEPILIPTLLRDLFRVCFKLSLSNKMPNTGKPSLDCHLCRARRVKVSVYSTYRSLPY